MGKSYKFCQESIYFYYIIYVINKYLFLLHYFNLQLNYSQIAFKKATKIGREAVKFNSERNIFIRCIL